MEHLCNNCIHKDVCGRYAATWGMKSCEHFLEMPKKGEWVDVRGIPSVCLKDVPVVKCSKCEIYFCDLINNHHYMYHYCPNCGADMRGKEDG